jgi:hypothetical protein
MTKTTALRWAYAAAAAGLIGNGLLAAFYVSFAMQDFGDPRGVAASLGSAADYAGILQNLLLVAVTAVVYQFFSRQQRFDRGPAGRRRGGVRLGGGFPSGDGDRLDARHRTCRDRPRPGLDGMATCYREPW